MPSTLFTLGGRDFEADKPIAQRALIGSPETRRCSRQQRAVRVMSSTRGVVLIHPNGNTHLVRLSQRRTGNQLDSLDVLGKLELVIAGGTVHRF